MERSTAVEEEFLVGGMVLHDMTRLFQTPTRQERDEENVEETNNERGDEGSPLSSGDGDRGNGLRFYYYMFINGHKFYMCNGKLLWYKPDIGYYLEEDRACLFELRGLIGECGCIRVFL